MTPRVGEHFVETKPPITGDDLGLGSLTSQFSLIWNTPRFRRTRWPPRKGGRPASDFRHTP
jgi:hypothetical protein